MSRHIFGMPMLLPMAPLHLLSHNDQNEVKPYFLNHGMPLVLALLSYNCIISSTILFIRWRQLKQSMISNWLHCQWHHFVCEVKMIETRFNMTFMVLWYQYCHCITLMASSIATLLLLIWNDQISCNMTFSFIWHCRH